MLFDYQRFLLEEYFFAFFYAGIKKNANFAHLFRGKQFLGKAAVAEFP